MIRRRLLALTLAVFMLAGMVGEARPTPLRFGVFLAGDFSADTLSKAMTMGLMVMWRERLHLNLGIDSKVFTVEWLDNNSARYAQLNPRLGFVGGGGVSIALARLDEQGNPVALVMRRGPFVVRVESLLDNPALGQLMDAGDMAAGRLARALGHPMPWVGVYLLDPDKIDNAEAVKDHLRRWGAVVYHVTSGSSAFRAGLREGDQIVQVNGRPVRGVRDYVKAMRGRNAVGRRLWFAFWRAGQVHRTVFRLRAYP